MNDSGKPLIYIETTIPSYLVGRQSEHITLLYHQFQTREWWDGHRHEFRTVVSTEVIVEINRGNPQMAALRLAAVEGIEEIIPNESVLFLADVLAGSRILPAKAAADIMHLAFATAYSCDFLLTWNCKHINNPFMIEKLRTLVARYGFLLPTITTPTALLGITDQPDELD